MSRNLQLGLIAVKPLLDKLIRQSNEKNAVYYMVFLFVTTLIYTIFSSFGFDLFGFAAGYSFSWLIALYVLGAFMKKYEFPKRNVKTYWWLLFYFILVLLTWISKILIGEITERILGAPNRELIFLSYVSPTILGCAVCLVCLFYRMRLNEKTKTLISFAAPAAFGVYLFHVQPLVFSQVLTGSFLWIAELSEIIIPAIVLVVSVVIFALGICLDKIRIYLFKLLKINVLSRKIEELLRKIVNKLADYFNHIIVE